MLIESGKAYSGLFSKLFVLILLITGSFPGNRVYSQDLLTIEDAVQIALQNNYAILISQNEAEIAAKNHSLGNAGFLPRIDANASQSKSITDSKQEFLSGQVVDRTGAETDNRSASIDLNWTLFDGFKMLASYSKLKSLKEIGKLQLKQDVEANIAAVIEAYYDIVQQKLNLEVARETVSISEDRLRIAEDNFELGAASRLEMLQARVDLNSDRSALLRQEVLFANAKTVLNQLMGRPIETEFTVTDSIALGNPLNHDELVKSLMENNTAIRLSRERINTASKEFREIRAERFPKLGFNVGYDYSKSESEAGFVASSRTTGLSYRFDISLNLFNGFNLNRREQNARIDIRNREIELQEILSLVEASFQTEFASYQNSLERVRMEQENLEVADENVDVSLERFRLGAITALELREAQRNYIAARNRLISALYEAKQSETELLRLAGKLVQAEVAQ